MTSIKKNFLYNTAYQVLVLIIPLITTPYISRVLGVENIGIYSYTYSIVSYFILLAMLGINNYGNRSIAQKKNDKKELSRTFLSIYMIQLLASILMIIIYTVYVMLFEKNYKMIALIEIFYLFGTAFDISWFFFGLEEFKITISRNIIIRLLSLIGIFTLVKIPSDLWKYTLILSSSSFISQLIVLPFLFKRISFEKIVKEDIIKHIKPSLLLFVPVVAVSLYKIMDKTMLGIMSNITDVGYYEQAEKIVLLPMSIITAFSSVMLPRMSNNIKIYGDKMIKGMFLKSMKFILFLAFPLCFGILSISNIFVPVFLGDNFINTIPLVNLLCVTIIIISFGNIYRYLYYIPKGLDKEYTISAWIGAIVNIIINSLLIPKYGATGACIGTIIAELSVTIFLLINSNKILSFKEIVVNCYQPFCFSIIMYLAVTAVGHLKIDNINKLIIQIFLGITIYSLFNIKYIKSLIVRSKN